MPRSKRSGLVPALLAASTLCGVAAASPASAAPPLTVLGDSYSIPVHDGARDWPLLLRARGLVGRIDDFARFGATASSGWHINFAQQLQRWRRAGRPLGVTVVYLGFNDVGVNLARSRADYAAGIDELVAAGATSGGNRLLLVEPHDVGSTPLNNRTAKRGFLRRQTEDWDGFVAFTAHHAGAAPVDVFAAIDRVLANPGRYGFTNVTTADHAHAATTALYDDDFHVGQHGQAIIADTIAARLR
jgi:phospholipase/lecithinase/hemolysin